MQTLTQILTITLKELRELLHRPVLVLTLILGPLTILILFGIGSDASPNPPRAIVVIPPGQEQPRLLQSYEREFANALAVTEYTTDEQYARALLGRNRVDAVLILPPTPFETIAGGRRATIQVLYNEIDPLWRGFVPRFVRGLASELNRAIFLQTAGEQRVALADASGGLNRVIQVLDRAIAAIAREDWQTARVQVRTALGASDRLMPLLEDLGPQAAPLRTQIERSQARLRQVDALLGDLERELATATPDETGEGFGLVQTRQSLEGLLSAITAYTAVPPEVVIAPLAIETQLVARLTPDFITFFSPAIMALLLQHVAVSLGALALVRERLAGTFDLFVVAPISNLQLLLGKYLAYLCFTLVIAGALLAVLLGGLDVPIFGSPWRLAFALLLLALASVGLGFALSLLAASERQAVQLSMLALLGIVFFSGFALPLKALRQPALTVSYAMPATYGVILFQDVMLRGLPGSNLFILILAGIAAVLFLACLILLHWRTRAL